MLVISVDDGDCEDVSCVVSILVVLAFVVVFILMTSTFGVAG